MNQGSLGDKPIHVSATTNHVDGSRVDLLLFPISELVFHTKHDSEKTYAAWTGLEPDGVRQVVLELIQYAWGRGLTEDLTDLRDQLNLLIEADELRP